MKVDEGKEDGWKSLKVEDGGEDEDDGREEKGVGKEDGREDEDGSEREKTTFIAEEKRGNVPLGKRSQSQVSTGYSNSKWRDFVNRAIKVDTQWAGRGG